jgi:hypothetical protein
MARGADALHRAAENGFGRLAVSIERLYVTEFDLHWKMSRNSSYPRHEMRIAEILLWNHHYTEQNGADPHLDFQAGPLSDLSGLANAFTRRGLVKSFWNLNGSEGQPSGSAPPDAETELIPSGTLEPTTASWEAEPVETEPQVGRHELVPFR